jgi:hypothetical protein
MIDAQTISIVFAGLSIGVAALYYTLTLQNTRKNQELSRKAQELTAETRQAQLFIQICNQTLSNPTFMKGYYIIRDSEWKDYAEYLEFLGEPGSKNYNDIFLVGGIMETIGVLVEEGLVDIRLIESLMRRIVIEYYEKMKPMLNGRTRMYNLERGDREPLLQVWKAEYLYHEMMEYIENHPDLKT